MAREAKPAAIVRLGCSKVASFASRARVAWREAKPAAIVELGCNQVASYARKVLVVRSSEARGKACGHSKVRVQSG